MQAWAEAGGSSRRPLPRPRHGRLYNSCRFAHSPIRLQHGTPYFGSMQSSLPHRDDVHKANCAKGTNGAWRMYRKESPAPLAAVPADASPAAATSNAATQPPTSSSVQWSHSKVSKKWHQNLVFSAKISFFKNLCVDAKFYSRSNFCTEKKTLKKQKKKRRTKGGT